jgi:hypothetical protein
MNAMLEARIVATKTHLRATAAQGAGSPAARMTPSSQGEFAKVLILARRGDQEKSDPR